MADLAVDVKLKELKLKVDSSFMKKVRKHCKFCVKHGVELRKERNLEIAKCLWDKASVNEK